MPWGSPSHTRGRAELFWLPAAGAKGSAYSPHFFFWPQHFIQLSRLTEQERNASCKGKVLQIHALHPLREGGGVLGTAPSVHLSLRPESQGVGAPGQGVVTGRQGRKRVAGSVPLPAESTLPWLLLGLH